VEDNPVVDNSNNNINLNSSHHFLFDRAGIQFNIQSVFPDTDSFHCVPHIFGSKKEIFQMMRLCAEFY